MTRRVTPSERIGVDAAGGRVSGLPASGVLPVDKPVGPTSHDIVAAVRRALGTRQVGHTGTLDPFASGLLLVCFGSATRLAEYLTPLPKTYRAVMRLGERTDTDDLTGAVVETHPIGTEVDETAVAAALEAQVGAIQQVPPAYSAKKVGGERMYAAARRGEDVARAAVPVTIHAIRVLRIDLPDVEFEVTCGSGTYIRAIARDVGDALGVGGHLRALRRTASGSYVVEGAVPLDRLEDTESVGAAILSPAAAVSHLPAVRLDEAALVDFGHGRPVPAADELPAGVPVALLDAAGALVGIGERDGARVRPRKVLLGSGGR
jgi:tRNA pseudouridine55 synthase